MKSSREEKEGQFDFISNFFDEVGRVLTSVFKQFTDFLSDLFGGSDGSASSNKNSAGEDKDVSQKSSANSKGPYSKNRSETPDSSSDKFNELSDESFERLKKSFNDNKLYNENIKKYADIFLGMFLTSPEAGQDNFFQKNSEQKKEVINQYFEKLFNEKNGEKDKLFTEFPELLDAIVEAEVNHAPVGPSSSVPRWGASAEVLSGERSLMRSPR